MLRVSYEGRSVEYRSVQELKDAIAEVKSSINAGTTTRIRQIRMYSDKGF
jgi:hypothetical protein